MDAIILAGGKTSPKDPLYELAGGGLKSLLPIAGKPMVQWLLDAISSSKLIDNVVVIGIGETNQFTCSKTLFSLPDAGTLLENIQQGAEFLQKLNPRETHFVSFSADIPAVTPEIIDAVTAIYQQSKYDVYYAVVERSVMEKRYPGSRRTYTKLKDVEICGTDMNAIRKMAALDPNGIWVDLIRSRKNPLKQAALVGLDTFALVLLRLLTLDELAERVCTRLGITGKVIQVPFAEIGMDVDKPFQFEIVQQDLMR